MNDRKGNIFSKITAGLDKILVWFGIVLGASLGINMVTAVLFRYVFNSPIFWADELSLFLFAWLTFIGATLSVRRMEMPAVTLLHDRLSPNAKKAVDVIIQLIILFFTGTVLYYAYQWITSPSVVNQLSPTVSVNLWIVYLVVPVSFLCTAIFSVEHIVRILLGTSRKEGEHH